MPGVTGINNSSLNPVFRKEGTKNKDTGVNTTDIKEDVLWPFQAGWQQYSFADQIQLTGLLIRPQEGSAGRTHHLCCPSIIK